MLKRENRMQYGFYIDSERCTGCKTCMAACKDKNNLPVGMNFRRVCEFSGGQWQKNADGSWENGVFAYYLSIACNHCENPVCTQVCPTKAHFKRKSDGLVLIDPKKCIGCGACAKACPYGAPQLDVQAHKMRKCDACQDRIQNGLNPACVDACPQRAIEFGEISKLRELHGCQCSFAPLPDDKVTQPNLVIKPNRNAKPSGVRGRVHFPLKDKTA